MTEAKKQADNSDRDPLGLKLDTSDPLKHPPAICLYGVSGAGKSGEAARAFKNPLYIQSSSTVLIPHAANIAAAKRAGKATDLVMPKRITIPKAFPDGKLIDPRPSLDKILDAARKAAQRGERPYDAYIFDEWTEFGARINAAIGQDPKYGNNAFARINAVKAVHHELSELPKQTGAAMILVCHEMPPVFDMKGESSPTRGRLLHMGGPRFPIKTLTAEISGMMDVVLRILIDEDVTGKTKRVYQTELTPEWICKFRGSDEVRGRQPLGLRELLLKGEYCLP